MKDKNKEYQKKYRLENKDKIKIYMKKYREFNKDKIKAYREANKQRLNKQKREYMLEYRKRTESKIKRGEWLEKNKERLKEWRKKYYQEHGQEKREYARKWKKEHPEWEKEYGKSPKRIAYLKKYYQTLKYKKRKKEYYQRPEVKKRMKEYSKKNREKILERVKDWREKNKSFCVDCGKKIKKESTRCLSCANKGTKNPSWIGGKSFEPYTPQFNAKFRRAIRKRDNYICMLCGIHQERLSRALSVHHINYDKKLSIQQNCISLCLRCHNETKENRKHWTKFFQSLLAEKYDYQYSETGEIVLNLGNFENGK